MIVLSKLFTVLVLPPGCIIAALILVTVFIPRRYKFAPALVAALLYALSIQPVSELLLRPLEDAYSPLRKGWALAPDAIVVLGSGVVQGSPEAGYGRDTLGPDAMKRAVYAFTLRDYFSVPYIFSGGKIFDYDQETEADTAKRLLVTLGMDSNRILPENSSRNTWQNARETAKFGYKRVILVTSAYHMRRSIFCFEGNGMTVIPAPTDYKCNRNRKYDFFSFLPELKYMHRSHLALHEYIGLLCYRILY